jgi:hypothetical protein
MMRGLLVSTTRHPTCTHSITCHQCSLSFRSSTFWPDSMPASVAESRARERSLGPWSKVQNRATSYHDCITVCIIKLENKSRRHVTASELHLPSRPLISISLISVIPPHLRPSLTLPPGQLGRDVGGVPCPRAFPRSSPTPQPLPVLACPHWAHWARSLGIRRDSHHMHRDAIDSRPILRSLPCLASKRGAGGTSTRIECDLGDCSYH